MIRAKAPSSPGTQKKIRRTKSELRSILKTMKDETHAMFSNGKDRRFGFAEPNLFGCGLFRSVLRVSDFVFSRISSVSDFDIQISDLLRGRLAARGEELKMENCYGW